MHSTGSQQILKMFYDGEDPTAVICKHSEFSCTLQGHPKKKSNR